MSMWGDIMKIDDDTMWIPPARSMVTGHRVSIGPYKPVATYDLNWRWWLAEIPMRMLAKHVAKAESTRGKQGEEYTGNYSDELADQELGPE